jgi:serine/threonine protein phosphatase PrpC
MESRFRLSSITETEELLRLRSESIEPRPRSLFGLTNELETCPLPIVEEEGPEMSIVTGAFKMGKTPFSCEDAYFIHPRGFGVADGVSGWNDYGFSSSMFST